MPSSQRGVAIGQGVSRSAKERRCDRCGRNGAVVERFTDSERGLICRWALDGKCADPGAWITRRV